MSLHVVKGTHITDVAAESRLKEWFTHQRQGGKPVYYILPSRKWLTTARRRQPGLACYTFDDLADVVLRKANQPFLRITEGEREAIFLDILLSHPEFSEKSIDEVRHHAKALADTYGQLKRLGLGLSSLPDALRPLQPFMQAFDEEYILKQRTLDPENCLLEAATRLDNALIILHGCTIVVDGYFDFSPLQYRFLESLRRAGMPMTIYVPNFGDAKIVQETIGNLQELGFTMSNDWPARELPNVTYHVCTATTIEEEVHGVLNHIRLQTTDGHFDEHCLIFANEDLYLPNLLRIAKQKRIPIAQTQRISLKDTLFLQTLKLELRTTNHVDSNHRRQNQVDLVLKLMFPSPAEYALWKQVFITRGVLPEHAEVHLQTFDGLTKSLQSKDTWFNHLDNMLAGVENLSIPSRWRNVFRNEADTRRLLALTVEWKALDESHACLMAKKQAVLSQRDEFSTTQIHRDAFIDWFLSALEQRQVFVERAQANGIRIHSLRDVALFTGRQIYVLGMNEGVLPTESILNGYFQNAHLDELKLAVPFGRPTPETWFHKQKVMFEQLRDIAHDVTLSYVVGLDSRAPLLPSRWIHEYASDAVVHQFSRLSRMSESDASVYVYDSDFDRLQKIAYHHGAGYQIGLPDELSTVQKRIGRLTTGVEQVESRFTEQLKKTEIGVSSLERYAECPFRYSIERVFGIEETDRDSSRISALDTGNMFHKLVPMFYQRLDLIGVPFRAFKERKLKDEADKALQECFDACWDEQVVRSNRHVPRGTLDAAKTTWWLKVLDWWQAEFDHFWNNGKLEGMSIRGFELPQETTFDWDEPVKLTMRLDRLDEDAEGFAIYDYKTGNAEINALDQAKQGVRLQLPLYLRSVSEQKPNSTPYGGTYVTLKSPATRGKNGIWAREYAAKFKATRSKKALVDVLSVSELNELVELENTLQTVWRGTFEDYSVQPYDVKTCKYCSWKSICRVAETNKGGEVEQDEF